ncbi:MAG: hypothetical protein AB2689_12790, partial [Candidatus Thiodiazotropha taylori]
EGFSRRTLTIDIINDTLYEQESSFTLILSNAGGGAVISDPSTALIRIIDDDALPFVSIQSPTPSSTLGSSSSSLFDQQKSSDRQSNRNSRDKGSSGLQVFEIKLRKSARSKAEELERTANADAETKQKADDKSSCGSAEDQSNCAADTETSSHLENREIDMLEETAGEESQSDPTDESEAETQTESSANPPAEPEPAAESEPS